jgi:hypothetical protein
MEVASLLTSKMEICDMLEKFIMDSGQLKMTLRDQDTIYFEANDTGRNELYYHFNNDVDHELSFNFSEEALLGIEDFFGDKIFHLIDLSYKRESFFTKMMSEFTSSLIAQYPEFRSEVLLDHPLIGLMYLDETGVFKKAGGFNA